MSDYHFADDVPFVVSRRWQEMIFSFVTLHSIRVKLAWWSLNINFCPLFCRAAAVVVVVMISIRRLLLPSIRAFSSEANAPNEQKLIERLQARFPKATDVAVVDVSGGCGSMFEVFVEAPDFKGLRIVKQHKLVNDALKSEIKEMHGLRVSTAVSPDSWKRNSYYWLIRQLYKNTFLYVV